MKVHASPERGKVRVSVTAGRTLGYIAFAAEMARGECLCEEIAASDRPCLTCEGRAVVDAAVVVEPTSAGERP